MRATAKVRRARRWRGKNLCLRARFGQAASWMRTSETKVVRLAKAVVKVEDAKKGKSVDLPLQWEG